MLLFVGMVDFIYPCLMDFKKWYIIHIHIFIIYTNPYMKGWIIYSKVCQKKIRGNEILFVVISRNKKSLTTTDVFIQHIEWPNPFKNIPFLTFCIVPFFFRL